MTLKTFIQKVANRMAPQTWVPPGHFYSPIVDPSEIKRRRATIFRENDSFPGIDLRVDHQLALIDRLVSHYTHLPFSPDKQDGLLYHYNNPNFGYGDAVIMSCLLMSLQPRAFIEFGSGYSSCAALDICQTQGIETKCTFIDPYPQLLKRLIGQHSQRCVIVESSAQDIDLSLIDVLGANDVLFIDSTHVTKAGSDVNFHLFTILPRLKSGVIIHFHDIFYPFEYPEAWLVDQNRSWNEIYILRAFLMNNSQFEIVLFNHFLEQKFPDKMRTKMPLFMQKSGSGLWLRKL